MDYPGKVITKTAVTPTQTSATGVWTLDDAAAAVKNNNWPIAGVPNPISKSLRFNSADSAYLNRTFGTPTNRNIWTWSGWIKRSALGNTAGYRFFEGGDGTSANTGFIGFGDGTGVECIRFYNRFSSTTNIDITTAAVFRDVSAWYHVVVAYDSAQATQANRLLMYVNGVNYTWSGTAPSSSQTSAINTSAYIHNIGVSPWNTSTYFSGYLTEINFIDGQALTPSSFGMTDPQTGAWIPIRYTGTYGTNGFYLNFKDATSTTTLGYDYSGNANNWTTNNFSVTAGVGNDSLTDVPTPWIAYNTTGDVGGVVRGNYATWNPIYVIPSNTTTSFTNGNLDFSVTQAEGTGTASAVTTMPLPTSGKWYWEITPTSVATSATRTQIGVMAQSQINFAMANGPSGTPGSTGQCFVYAANGQKSSDATLTNYGNSYTANDVIGVAVDLDNNAIYFAKNGTWQNSGVPTSGASKTGAAYTTLAGSNNYFPAVGYWGTFVSNFGQRPFAYTAPSGFKALCTQNLPTPTIGATSTTQANDYFNTVLYTGNGSTQSITGVGFQPDFVWIKNRGTATDHGLFDAIRGTTKRLSSNLTNAETTEVNSLTAFNSDGFSVGATQDFNQNTVGIVAWNWKANGAGSSNTQGTITSTVSANTTAGFSIVTYTGNGVNNATVGHGLGAVPSFVIVKRRDSAENWNTKHSSLSSNLVVFLNTTDGQSAPGSGYIGNLTSSTVITLVNGGAAITNVNGSGATYVAYCFAAVAGYSAFGSYTGNGSSDGPFVYLGFRPRWILTKAASGATGSWWLYDTARSTFNEMTDLLRPDLSNADTTQSFCDALSNGFKIRNSGNNTNTATYIYAAFAESPFKYALAR